MAESDTQRAVKRALASMIHDAACVASSDLEEAATDLVALAHAEHDNAWVETESFVRRALATLDPPPPTAAALKRCHAADLYLAIACSLGVRDALNTLERQHIARVPRYVSAINSSHAFGEEVTQLLRTRILVGEGPELPPRITTYAGRGPLGGWIRMSAVRLARDLARRLDREAGGQPGEMRDVRASDVDPEIALMKRLYGESVSRALAAAITELDGESRTLLRMHYIDGLTIDQVGVALGVSRATGARILARARGVLVQNVRQRIAQEFALDSKDADSLMRFVQSRIEVSIVGALRA